MKASLRAAYGETLVALGAENPDVVVLEADLGKSTMGCLFEQAYPERFFEMGIAEQDMASTAAGLALGGKIPFCATFAVFMAGRAFDQIRQTISIGKLNVKLCGSSCGLSDFGDGSTHQSVEDVAIMRAIPGMTILSPADANQTRKAVRAAAQYNGPVYLRITRNDTELITSEDAPFEIGKIYPLTEGSQITIFATGSMVETALAAEKILRSEGTSVKVVNVPTIKPLDRNSVIRESQGSEVIIVAEEHNVIGGLCSAISECLAAVPHAPIGFVAIEDSFGTSAESHDELKEKYGLTAKNICEKVHKLQRGDM